MTGAIRPEMLQRGGTVATAGGALRNVLDAALSSPSRRGVIVDDQGALLGTIRAHQVLAEIEERARPEVEEPAHTRVGDLTRGGVGDPTHSEVQDKGASG